VNTGVGVPGAIDLQREVAWGHVTSSREDW
jgi:hypothetical protein